MCIRDSIYLEASVQISQNVRPLGIGAKQVAPLAVSYTHLDVYKRQDIIRGFHQIRQGMAAPTKMCCIRCGTRNQPQMSSHERSSVPFLFPDAEFLAFKLVGRNYAAFPDGGGIRLRTGIFHKGAQNTVCRKSCPIATQ